MLFPKVKLSILFIFIAICGFAMPSTFHVRQALLQNQEIKLDGEWDFYWQKLITYEQLQNAKLPVPVKVIVPGYWSSFLDSSNIYFPVTGFATYVTRIILPVNYRSKVAFNVPSFDSACRLFINDSLIYQAGEVGESLNSEIPAYHVETICYTPQTDTLTVLVQVSNFNHRRGGFWRKMSFGPANLVMQSTKRQEVIESFLLGILLLFGVFFLMISSIQWQKSTFLFSITFIAFFFRGITINNYLIQVFIDLDWVKMIRIEYFSTFVAFITCLWGFYFLFETKIVKWVITIFTVILLPVFFAILFFRLTVFSYTVYALDVLIILSVFVFVYQTVKMYKEKSDLSLGYWIGILFIIFAGINDMLLANSIEFPFDFYLLQWSLVFFILIQSLTFLNNYVKTSNQEKRLRIELGEMNKNLEKMVEQRTAEIKNQSEIVEIQKSIIQIKNDDLKQDIKLKNRILSIIGHDLRSPLGNLVQGFEYLEMEGIQSEQITRIINDLRLSSESLLILVENLLSWALNQQQKLNWSPALYKMEPVITSVIHQVTPLANAKQISINMVCDNSVSGYFDEPTIVIVLRNLLSNAIKYTPKNGSVHLSVQGLNDRVNIEICDNGVGIDPNKLKRILKGKDTESSVGTNNEPGTGLGLQLCVDFVRFNNGKLKARSAIGAGSCFWFTLPISSNE